MTGYVRVDTSNNIADGNVISADDLDNEFDGVQAAFNATTGHTHGGGVGEGAPITKLGPTNDVTVSASLLAPKTTNTVDIGSSSLKYKDLYLAGNASIGGTLAVTGATTLSAALTYGGVTLSNAVTGTGNMVLSNSPTLVTPALGTPSALVGTNITGTAAGLSIGGNAATATTSTNVSGGTASVTTLSASGAVTLSGGTATGVAYLNGSKVLTTGSALTFDGTNLTNSGQYRSSGNGVFAVTSSANSLFIGGGGTLPANNTYQTTSNHIFQVGGTERLRINSSGNLGLGVTPSAWGATSTALQNRNASFWATSAAAYFGYNYFFDGSVRKYIASSFATEYTQLNGQHIWYTASSGTAGNAISFTQAMTLGASGNLLIGSTTDLGAKLMLTQSVQTDVNGANGVRINGTGNNFIGIGYSGLDATVSAGSVGADNTSLVFRTASAGSEAERARIDSTGNLIQSVPTTPPTLATNGQMVFNLTSNTNLRVSVRGSDGVTRTANITLA